MDDGALRSVTALPMVVSRYNSLITIYTDCVLCQTIGTQFMLELGGVLEAWMVADGCQYGCK